MPQGGIDEGEKPWATAQRELEEETGIPPKLVERIAECPERLKYDLPEEIRGTACGAASGRASFRTGISRASSATTATSTSPPNTPSSTTGNGSIRTSFPDLIVPFKRDLYRRLIDEFRDHF